MIVSLSSVRIVDVVAGQYHSMALSATGHVYTWGWGIHGQLGCATYDNQYYPRRLFFPQPVCRIAAGHAHSLILTCDGKLFGFGSNAFGQLESARVGCKTAKPSRLMIGGKESVIVVRIATAYFQSVSQIEHRLRNVRIIHVKLQKHKFTSVACDRCNFIKLIH